MGSHVLGVALAEAVKMPLKQFAEKYLLSKMGVTLGDWDTADNHEQFVTNVVALYIMKAFINS